MYCVGNSGTSVVRTYFLLCFTAQDLTLQMSAYFFIYKIQYHSQIHDCYINWRSHSVPFSNSRLLHQLAFPFSTILKFTTATSTGAPIQYHSQIHDCYINWRSHLTRLCAWLAVTTNYRKLNFFSFGKSLRYDVHFKFRENPSRVSRYKRQTLGQFRFCIIPFPSAKKTKDS